MNTQVSYEELVNVYAPLWDASQMIERLKSAAGDGFACEFFTALEDKLESAKTPGLDHIDRIENANPGQFS
jgi:hypothetical protein